jgi:hypothetical protein
MSGKIVAAVVAAALLATTGLADARTNTTKHHATRAFHAAVCDPYAGTYLDGVAPYSANLSPQCNPYAGTYWDGVAPY